MHIYRLVSAQTVEENILVKAQQKRHLDFLVMTEGNFTNFGGSADGAMGRALCEGQALSGAVGREGRWV